QLDPVPWRIADDGVEAAGQPLLLPFLPDTGEGDLPVQEPFFLDQFARLPQDVREAFGIARGAKRLLAGEDADGIAEIAVEEVLDERDVGAPAQGEPVE